MKRIILLVTVTTVFIFSSSAAWAAPKEGKGKPDTPGVQAEKGEVKAAKTVDAGQEKMKAGKEKAEKEVKAVREKGADEAEKSKEQAAKKTEAVKEKGNAAKEKAVKETKAVKEKTEDEADEDAEKAAGQGKGQGKEKADEAKGKPEDKGLGKDQKAAALAKQLQHEDQKHAKRQARLAEMLKVAQDKGDEKAIARIQSLMDKENSRYQKKSTKMAERGTQEKIEKADDAGDEPEKTEDAATGETENE